MRTILSAMLALSVLAAAWLGLRMRRVHQRATAIFPFDAWQSSGRTSRQGLRRTVARMTGSATGKRGDALSAPHAIGIDLW
jgi:hypothetical protein